MIQKLMSWLCVHDDEVINQFTTKSNIEVLVSMNLVPKQAGLGDTRQKTVTDFKCNKCGRVERKIVEN